LHGALQPLSSIIYLFLEQASVYFIYQMAAVRLSNITWYAQCSSVYSASTLSLQRTHPVCFIIHLKISCLFSVSTYVKENSCNTGTWWWPWPPWCDLCSILYRTIPVSGICVILVRKPGTFSEISAKNLGYLGREGDTV